MSGINRWLVAFDLDRTLIRDDTLSATLEEACITVGIDITLFRTAKKTVEARGESFFELQFLHTQYPQEKIKALRQSFSAVARPNNLLYPDVLPLLAKLSKHNVPFLIFTWGDPEWQSLKLNATLLDKYPTLITESKNKGKLIRQWQHGPVYLPEGLPPQSAADGVLLVDDKAISFADLPHNCQGAWLQRSNEPLMPSQSGQVPTHVSTITGLNECLQLLRLN